MKRKLFFALALITGFLLACNNKGDAVHSAHDTAQVKKDLYTCPMPQDSVFSDKPGTCPKCGMDLVKVEGHTNHGQPQASSYYTCPMHPEIKKDGPGQCPICGMDLVKKELDASVVAGVELQSLLRPTNEYIISTVPVTVVQKEQIVAEVDALGRVEYDTRMIGSVSARINGRIEKLYVRYKYQFVKKGQKIMDIYSPELLTAQQNLLFVMKNDRGNQSLLQASKQKLLLLGMSSVQIDNVMRTGRPLYAVSVYSNYSGHLHNTGEASAMNSQQTSGSMGSDSFNPNTELLTVKEGMYVQKGQAVFNIYNPSRAWAMLSVYADKQALIKKGQFVKITPETAPAKAFQGKIDFIEPFYRNGTRTTTVRVYFDNSALRLPVGSQVRGLIIAHPETAYWLPKESVVTLGVNRIVFVKEREGFRAKAVVTGFTTAEKIQITKGLADQDSVARNAQYLIDSESFIKVKE
jgi:membrane fusion protein, copper/silver efflux system